MTGPYNTKAFIMNSGKVAIVSVLLLLVAPVTADSVNSPLAVGRPNTVIIKIDSANAEKCNIEVILPWQEKFELEVDSAAREAKFEITPRERGSISIKWGGKTKFRGLKTVPACAGSGDVTFMAGYTSETAKPLWDRLFSTLSLEQADCVRVGMDVSNLRLTSLDPSAEVVDPNDARVKPVFSRCDSFFKTRQGFIDRGWSDQKPFPCVVNGAKTTCEGGYAERLQDGRLKRVSKVEAFRLHFENKAWTVSQREPDATRESRLRQEEHSRAEEEQQREAKRIADEKATKERTKRAEEERQREAKRLADEKAAMAKSTRVDEEKRKAVEASQTKAHSSINALQDVSRNLWADRKFGGCTNAANILRWKYDPTEGLLMYQWKDGSIASVISHPRQNKQLTEYQFLASKSPQTSFIYRERKFAKGNGPIEVMTGDPNTLIYDYIETATLENANLLRVERTWQRKLDTKALFDSRSVRYEKVSVDTQTLERCN